MKYSDPTGEIAFAAAIPYLPAIGEGLKWCAIGVMSLVVADNCSDDNGCFGEEIGNLND